MHLIQILLPLYDNAAAPQPAELFGKTREELIGRFGGLTAYTRAPAKGLWQEDASTTMNDDIVIYEVMTESLDNAWWHTYRGILEQRFRQEAIIVRALPLTLL
ncbi:hypothetical protein RY831_22180 [Noviherbaspirillum sp. CPCC 100848]|uniref:DUF1330 domain-containing protein n=1 Tax=Noviherbaspirillum album TaxID=3080276 RepID=A0ABU6JE04_9BURK|nr:hypothetical protein [Noviherbaspirillum sp. CPCC 100848]MEC4721880.1 hypothetical protein [Noviherbaspirillum sp. CPCC 100848]